MLKYLACISGIAFASFLYWMLLSILDHLRQQSSGDKLNFGDAWQRTTEGMFRPNQWIGRCPHCGSENYRFRQPWPFWRLREMVGRGYRLRCTECGTLWAHAP